MALTKVTGELVDIGDLDISNVGSIQLDSIAGDADSNTSITFSGSDVITVATGGSTAATFNADQTTTFSGAVTFNGPNLNITADDARLLVEEADGTNIGWYGDITGGGVGGCFLYNHGGTATVQLRADATASFINNGANFGIGTASPQGGLHLVGPSSGQVELYLSDADEGTGASDSLLITKSGTSSYIYDRDASSSLRLGAADNHSILFIDGSNERVGIGTTSPARSLHVKGGSASSMIRVDNGADGHDTGFEIYQNGSRKWEIHSDDSQSDCLSIRNASGTEKFRFLQGGGITFNGDTASANALDEYEEGTWTPQIKGWGGSNVSISTVSDAVYTRVGRLVYISAYLLNIDIAGMTDGTYVVIHNLPFASDADNYAPIVLGYNNTNIAGGYVENNGIVYLNNSSGTEFQQQNNDLTPTNGTARFMIGITLTLNV